MSRRYDSFGNIELGGSNGYAFTGREWDGEASLAYCRARYYDPKIGRFISEDPLGFAAGMNVYAYVRNNPANRRDPLGLQAVPLPPSTMEFLTFFSCAEAQKNDFNFLSQAGATLRPLHHELLH